LVFSLFTPSLLCAWNLNSSCREALVRFQGKPAKAIVESAAVETGQIEIIGADTGRSYKAHWKVNIQTLAPTIDFNFESDEPARIQLSFESPQDNHYDLKLQLPRGEAEAMQDLNLFSAVLKHLNERAVSGETIEWEINDPNLVDLLDDRLQKLAQMPQLDLPGDVRRATGRVEDDPLFFDSLLWDTRSDAFFALTSVEDGLEAMKRVNQDPEARKLLIDTFRNSPYGEALSSTGPWIVDIKLVAASDHLRALSAKASSPGDESKLLFPFRYKIVLESF
jgi:hypothetical protein